MKINKVIINNRKKCFELIVGEKKFILPYSYLKLECGKKDKILSAEPDKELGFEAFTYQLTSGKTGTIHLDQVLEYNQDFNYRREMLLYRLTLAAQKLLKARKVSKREIIRRLKTSPTQFYRLLDQSNYHKTIDQMVLLIAALDAEVELILKKAA